MAAGVFRTRAWIRRRQPFLATAVAVAAAASLTPAPRERPRRALKSRRRHGLAAAGVVSTKAAALPLAKGAAPIRRPQVRRRVGRALVATKTPAAAPTSLAPDVRRLPIRAEQRRRPRRTGRLPGVAVAAPQLSLTSRSGPRRKPAVTVPRSPRLTAGLAPTAAKSPSPPSQPRRPPRTAAPRVRRSRPAPATRTPVAVTSAPLRRAPWARRRADVWMMRRPRGRMFGAVPVVGTGQACFGDFGVMPAVEARLRVGDAIDAGLVVRPQVETRLHVGC